MKTFDDLVKMFEPTFAEAVLTEEPVEAFRVGKPGTRINSFVVTFTREGITIAGDWTPERNGSVSALGYGKAWFAGELSPDYLAEKFLTQKWVADLAADELDDEHSVWMEEATELGKVEHLREVIEGLRGGDVGEEWLYGELNDHGFVIDDGIPGYGYEPGEKARLVAIQRAFARLYHAQKAAPAGGRS